MPVSRNIVEYAQVSWALNQPSDANRLASLAP